MDLLPLIQSTFRLEGETVIRISTGEAITPRTDTKGYAQVSFRAGPFRRMVLRYHVVKFALAHGYIPPRIDHRDRDIRNVALDNLRASNARLNGANVVRPNAGIRVKRGRYQAYIHVRGQASLTGVIPNQRGCSSRR